VLKESHCARSAISPLNQNSHMKSGKTLENFTVS
jgi:hypothetical protein